MSDTATLTAPASAPVDPIGSMSPSERQQWRLTGEFPSTSSTEAPDSTGASTLSTPPADSSSAAPDAQAVSTDTNLPPASEPGTPKKANAETRKAELKAEIETLARQRIDLQREIESLSQARTRPAAPDATKTASSPVTQPLTLDAIVTNPDPAKPLLSDTEFYAAYPDATMGDFTRYVTRHELKRAASETAQQSARQTRETTFVKALEAAVAADPQYWEKVTPVATQLVPLDRLMPNQVAGPLNYAAQEIVESSNGPAIMAHLAANPALMAELRQADPRQAIRTIARISERVATPSVTPSVSVVKTTTSAPAPSGTTLGSRPTATSDEVGGAIATGDFARYKATMNRREVAS